MESCPSSKVILRMQGITKDYPGVRAVNNVDFDVRRGEVHALVGENGAGKSTLIKILAGVILPDAGRIWLNGQELILRSAQDAFRAGLSFIHQELGLVPSLNGAENIFLGRPYPTKRLGLVDWSALYKQARELIAQLDTEVPLDVPVAQLSPAMRTMISIARALSIQASVVAMDEPTASLTDQEANHLFRVIRSLKQRGVSVIYVSHRLEEIFAISDRVTVMRDGQVVATCPTRDIDAAELIRLMVGRNLSKAYPPRRGMPGKPLLEVRNLNGSYLRGVSFTLHQGEVLGVAGLAGAGRTELLRLLFGADKPSGGSILLEGRPIKVPSPHAAFSMGIALVPEERHSQGLILTQSVAENITLAHLSTFAKGGFLLNTKREAAVVGRLVQALHIKAANIRQPVSQLSGGNQQKVVFAKCLAKPPKILLLDEPTRGIDVGTKFEFYRIIRQLAEQGTGILLVSSELSELLGLSDRLLVLHEGRAVAMLKPSEIDQQTLLAYCYGRRPI